MKKSSLITVAVLFALIFLVLLVLIFQENQKLISEKEMLLLKNDSLHMQHLTSKKQAEILRNQLDSIRKKN